jgi:hypothetical protein
VLKSFQVFRQSAGIMPQLGSLIFLEEPAAHNVGHASSDWVLPPNGGEGVSILSTLTTWEGGSTSEESAQVLEKYL